MYFVLALRLFARESYEEVVRLPATGLPGTTALRRVNKSALSRARARLGPEPLESLFRSVAGSVATPGAFWRGLRLLAIDGTQIDVPDSTSNATTFDGPCLQDLTPTGFPQVRAVVLAGVGSHAVVDAEIGGWRDGEPGQTEPFARSVKKPPSRFPRKRSRSGMDKAAVGGWHGSKTPTSARSTASAATA